MLQNILALCVAKIACIKLESEMSILMHVKHTLRCISLQCMEWKRYSRKPVVHDCQCCGENKYSFVSWV